jgi:hypothetical protein
MSRLALNWRGTVSPPTASRPSEEGIGPDRGSKHDHDHRQRGKYWPPGLAGADHQGNQASGRRQSSPNSCDQSDRDAACAYLPPKGDQAKAANEPAHDAKYRASRRSDRRHDQKKRSDRGNEGRRRDGDDRTSRRAVSSPVADRSRQDLASRWQDHESSVHGRSSALSQIFKRSLNLKVMVFERSLKSRIGDRQARRQLENCYFRGDYPEREGNLGRPARLD